ncbi:DUF2510 domain-containing protein [Mycobacterium sp. M1]|uniref:DUF2510 domain-containing protein n=1 Tax=Mycolicibacter acidiphilus TaxID=2835306 RepID=A0ABS5RN76_9MYCO|nr:DUF2510 domain-containing protein [Mycolicibacter acidiphilus]MBS9535765.1 DUF2510 domain-containing protein [Mycolicibacter acidiphilus]
MTTPQTQGWYDDPDGSDALRYFDGEVWTPQRKRKPAAPQYPGTEQSVPPPGTGGHPPVSPGFAPPADPFDAYSPSGHTKPNAANNVPPWTPPPIVYGYPGPIVEAGSYPSAPVAGQGISTSRIPQQQWLARLQGGMVGGVDQAIGLAMAAGAVTLIAASFTTWCRARGPYTDLHGMGSVTLSFPGMGSPTASGTFTDGTVSGTVTNLASSGGVFLPSNTNPGWVSLVLGIVVLIAALAYLWLPQRKYVAAAVAAVSASAAVLCISHLFDIRGTFGDPADVAGMDFSVGGGLAVACLVSFGLAILGTAAYLMGAKQQPGGDNRVQ